MEAKAREQRSTLAVGLVKRWPGLRREHREAYVALLESGAGEGTRRIEGTKTAVESRLAIEWGCGASSVRRRLAAIVKAKLAVVRVRDCETRIRIVLPHTVPEAPARRKRIRAVGARDPQQPLPFAEPVTLRIYNGPTPPETTEPEPVPLRPQSGTGSGSAHTQTEPGGETPRARRDETRRDESATPQPCGSWAVAVAGRVETDICRGLSKKSPLPWGDRCLLLKAAALAESRFSEQWLSGAVEAMLAREKHERSNPKTKGGLRNPMGWLHTALAKGARLSREDFRVALAGVVIDDPAAKAFLDGARDAKPRGDSPANPSRSSRDDDAKQRDDAEATRLEAKHGDQLDALSVADLNKLAAAHARNGFERDRLATTVRSHQGALPRRTDARLFFLRALATEGP